MNPLKLALLFELLQIAPDGDGVDPHPVGQVGDPDDPIRPQLLQNKHLSFSLKHAT